MLRIRVVRQRGVRPGRHTGHEWIPNRYKETQSSIETFQRTIETVLTAIPELVPSEFKKKVFLKEETIIAMRL